MERTYEERINALIPTASAIADMKVEELGKVNKSITGVDGKPCTYSFWSEFFHKEMKRLACKEGLRNC